MIAQQSIYLRLNCINTFSLFCTTKFTYNEALKNPIPHTNSQITCYWYAENMRILSFYANVDINVGFIQMKQMLAIKLSPIFIVCTYAINVSSYFPVDMKSSVDFSNDCSIFIYQVLFQNRSFFSYCAPVHFF